MRPVRVVKTIKVEEYVKQYTVTIGYLHVNGDFIVKHLLVSDLDELDESPFVVKYWIIGSSYRSLAPTYFFTPLYEYIDRVTMIQEAVALSVHKERTVRAVTHLFVDPLMLTLL